MSGAVPPLPLYAFVTYTETALPFVSRPARPHVHV